MRKGFVLTAVFLMTVSIVWADEREVFLDLLRKGKMNELYTHLNKWEKKKPGDPELYIAFFNYYAALARKAVPSAGRIQGPGFVYDEDNINKALEYINAGIEKAPDRLDMYFGKIHILGETGRIEEQSANIIYLLGKSKQINNRWKWSDGKTPQDPEDFFLEGIQGYFNQWFETGDQYAGSIIEKTAAEEIKHYPGSVFGYSNMANYFMRKNDMAECEKYLLLAEKAVPENFVVCFNLGYVYYLSGRKAEAVAKWSTALKYADPEQKAFLQQYLTEM